MTLCQTVLRIALRRRKMGPLIVHQSSGCLQMMKSSGSQCSSCVVSPGHGEVRGRGKAGRALPEPRVSSGRMDPHAVRLAEDRARPSALCPENFITVWLCWAIRAAFQFRKSRLIVVLFTIHYEKNAEDCWRQEPLTSYFPFICRSSFINDSPL